MKRIFPLAILLLGVLQKSHSQSLIGFGEPSTAKELNAEKLFDSHLDTADIDAFIKEMSSHPHHIGSPGDKAVTEFIYNKYKSWGFDVHIESFYVLFPTPKFRLLEMTE